MKFQSTFRGGTRLAGGIINYFNGCGKLYEKSIARYAVHKITDINEKRIPYLKEYPFQGSKALDFDNFIIAELMERKAHLTESGLKQIIEIKKGMGFEKSETS